MASTGTASTEAGTMTRRHGAARPGAYAALAAGVAGAGAVDHPWMAMVAGTVVLTATAGALLDGRERMGSTLATLHHRVLDPFVLLAVTAALATAYGIAKIAQPSEGPTPGATVALVAMGLSTGAALVGLLRDRLREHAMELGREAGLVACIAAAIAWLTWVERSWQRRDVELVDAVLVVVAGAATLAAFVLAGRLAAVIGRAGSWFVAATGALVLAALFDLTAATSASGPWHDASGAASLAAVGLLGAGAADRRLVGLRTAGGVWPSRMGAGRIAVVLVAVLLVPAVTIGRLAGGVRVSVLSLAAASTVLTLAAVVYLIGLARDWGQLERRAQHDELTGLPNRRSFTERLALAVADAAAGGPAPAVLFCDLDRFKMVNDTLGHATGNDLLVAIAERLGECVPADALAARLGGDEFAVLIADTGEVDPMDLGELVRDALMRPIEVHGRTLHVDASIGMSRWPEDGDAPDALLRAADTAMYSAKDSGRGRVVAHSPALREEMESRFVLETALRAAVELGQLHLVYQPRVDLRLGRVVGAEALMRWHHPELGAVSPSRFIPVAEESGLIRSVGMHALREACAQLARWERSGLGDLMISVNLSSRQFELDHIADTVALVLRETGANPTCLELELTESLAHDVQSAAATIADLAEMGVRCTVDDFGTGYSGLSYLGDFPVRGVKIDRGFVATIDGTRQSAGEPAAVVAAVLALGAAFGLRVIAEGVETHEQLRFLIEHDCDEFQGHLFSPPVDAESFERLVALERTAEGPNRLDVLMAGILAAHRDPRQHSPATNVVRFGRRLARPG